MHFTKYWRLSILLAVTFLSSLFFWLIFYFKLPARIGFPNTTLETLYANYDGPNYMVIARCGYNKNCIGPTFSLPQALEYYPAHFPGYPSLIKFFHLFTTGPKAMLLATLFGSLLLTFVLYHFFQQFLQEDESYWLTLLFLFFPARFFVLRQIGAPETWFLALTLASIIYFRKQQYLFSAVFASLAQVFKSPGALLGIAYFVFVLIELFKTRNLLGVVKKYFVYLLIPATVFGVFCYYKFQTSDILAYFHSGDNFHLNTLPYLVFISTKSWLNTIWLEDVVYLYLIAFFAVYTLVKKYKYDIISLYPLIFTLAAVFVAHRDISRYISPVYPFVFLAFAKFLNLKALKIIFLILLPAIILFGVNFVCGNAAPISDWTPYL